MQTFYTAGQAELLRRMRGNKLHVYIKKQKKIKGYALNNKIKRKFNKIQEIFQIKPSHIFPTGNSRDHATGGGWCLTTALVTKTIRPVVGVGHSRRYLLQCQYRTNGSRLSTINMHSKALLTSTLITIIFIGD